MRYRLLELVAKHSVKGWKVLPEQWRLWFAEEWMKRVLDNRYIPPAQRR